MACAVATAAALCASCGGETQSLETRCIEWLERVDEGAVTLRESQREAMGDGFEESDLACSEANDRQLIGDDGSLSAGAIQIVNRCRLSDEGGCYPEGAQSQLLSNPAYRRLSDPAKLAVLVALVRFADGEGIIEPRTTVTTDKRGWGHWKSLEGMAAWSYEASVRPRALRDAVAEAVRSGVLEKGRLGDLLYGAGTCSEGEPDPWSCETVAYRIRARPE